MAYTRNTWKNLTDPTFDPEVDPPISADNLNNIEQGIVDAHSHIADTNNPHAVDKTDVGLSNVTNAAQLTASQLETTITDDDAKVPSSGAVVDYVSGHADMLKSSYDSNADGKVNSADAADAVPWSGVSGKPSTYPPESHNHDTSYEPIISTKKTAFNVDFGTLTGTACQGNDSRLSDARTPTSHGNEAHSSTFITAGDVHSNANDPSSTEKEALAGTSGTPSSTNKYVTNADSRMTDARTPASHTHGNITNAGYLGSTPSIPLITGTDGIIQAGAFGAGATDFAAGNHEHSGTYEPAFSKNTAFNKNFGTAAGDVCQGNDSRLSDARTPTSHTHGNITNAGAIGSTANLPVITTTSGVLTVGSFGSAANTFCVGNDSRLSDARAPTSHNNSAHSETYITTAGVTYEALNTNSDVGTGSSQVAAGNHTHSGVYEPVISTKNTAFNVNFGTGATDACVGNDSRLSDARTPTSHTHGNITNAGAIGSTSGLPIITTTSGVLTAGSFGSTSGTFCAGDDARLVTNAKQADRPFVFQTGHTAWATGLSNEEIGRIQLQTGETLYIRRVEIQIKGGGTSASLSVNAYDSTNTTQIASQTAGGVNTTGGNSGAAALVLIRLTNSVGSTQSASVYISGWIRS